MVRRLCVLSLLAFCTVAAVGAEPDLTPRQAIESAAAAAPAGVIGTFDVQVRSTGAAEGDIFLNTEEDYRDPRNVSVVISPALGTALTARYGVSPLTYFKAKHIRVTGQAQRVTIYFYANGVRTEKYYYQTHIIVTDPSQIVSVAQS